MKEAFKGYGGHLNSMVSFNRLCNNWESASNTCNVYARISEGWKKCFFWQYPTQVQSGVQAK